MRLHAIVFCVFAFSAVLDAQTTSTGLIGSILKEKLRVDKSLITKLISARSAEERKSILKAVVQTGSSASTNSNPDILSISNTKVSKNDLPESEIHAAINPTDTNNMVCSAMSNDGQTLTFPIYYTRDGGSTWSQSTFSPAPASPAAFVLGGGDPMFAFDTNGKLYYSWIDLYLDLSTASTPMDMFWVSSTDGGENWDRNETSDTVASGHMNLASIDNSDIVDKQWMVCDLSNSSGKNNLYCSLLQYYPTDQRVAMRIKGASDDGFRSTVLRPTATDYTFNQFTSIDCDDQGMVHMSFVGAFASDSMPEGEFRIFHIASTDGGKTIAKEQLVTPIRFLRSRSGDPTVIQPPTGMSRIQCLPQIACDKFQTSAYKGNVYIVWSAVGVSTHEANGLDIYFSRSTDHGQTWSTPVVINDDARSKPVHQAYASICVNADGVVIVGWYDFREDAAGEKAKYTMTYSFDGGRTFIKNFPVSTAASDFSLFVVDTTKNFGMGEYNQIVATRGYAIPFWGDVRSGERQIYCAKIPISANPLGDVEPASMSSITDGISLDAPHMSGSTASLTLHCQRTLNVEVDLTDIRGNLIRNLHRGLAESGDHTLSIDCSTLSSAPYFIVAHTRASQLSQKLVVVR